MFEGGEVCQRPSLVDDLRDLTRRCLTDSSREEIPENLNGVVIIYDLDGVLKPVLNRPSGIGQLDSQAIKFLQRLQERGAVVAIASNNPLTQHWLTRNQILREIRSSLGEDIPLLFPPWPLAWPLFKAKQTKKLIREFVVKIKSLLREKTVPESTRLVMISDSPRDKSFAEEVASLIGGDVPIRFGLIQSFLNRVPHVFRRLLPA